MAAHFFQVLGQADEVFRRVDGAGGVAQRALHMGAGFDGLVHRYLDVAQVVQRVENADDIDAVFHGFAHKGPDNIVGIVLIAQQILAPQQHLQLCVFHNLADFAQSLPGVFVQIPQAGIKSGSAPAFQGVKTRLVHFLQDGLKIAHRHTGGDQRLVGVPEHGFRDVDFHQLLPPSILMSQKNFRCFHFIINRGKIKGDCYFADRFLTKCKNWPAELLILSNFVRRGDAIDRL